MKLAANLSLLYPGLPLEARMAQAARDGFSGAEILFPYDLAPQILAAQLRKHGLSLILINTPLGSRQEKGLACLPGRQAEFLQGVERALDICRHTGCRSLHAMAGMPPQDANTDACRATLIDNLYRAALLASEVGVILTLEALNRQDMPGYFYHLPEQAVDIIAAVGHPGIRLQFDFYHCQREGLNLAGSLGKVLPLVHHVQFARPPLRQEPDLSDPAVRDALLVLQASGYAGWIGCEYHPEGDTSTGLAWRAAFETLLA